MKYVLNGVFKERWIKDFEMVFQRMFWKENCISFAKALEGILLWFGLGQDTEVSVVYTWDCG